MSRNAYPESRSLPGARRGLPPAPFDDEDDDDEAAGNAAGYGSLLGLSGGMRRKRPCLEVDPEEAEDAARFVQQVAARQVSGEDTAEPHAFTDLSGFAAAAAANGEEAFEEDLEEQDEPERSEEAAPVWITAEEPQPEPAPVKAFTPEPRAEPELWSQPQRKPPVEPEREPETEPAPEPIGEAAPPAPVAAAPAWQPSFEPRRHRLRKRIPAPASSRTIGQRLAWLARRVRRWLVRRLGR